MERAVPIDRHARARLVVLAAALAPALAASCALGPTSDPRASVRGPLASRNLHPLSLAVLAFRPRRAAIEAPGAWELGASAGYSSLEEVSPPEGTDSVVIDGELARFDLRARYGLGAGFDVEVELPFLYTTSGFLDDFVESFHDAFSLPDGGRELEENEQFAMDVIAGSDVLYSVEEDRFGIQDVPIYLARELRVEDEGGPGVSARAGVEVPTGDEAAGFGNGAVDWGLGLVAEKSLGRWTLFGGFDYCFPGDPPGFDDSDVHELEDYFALQLGTEFRWSNRLSLLFQTTWTSRLVESIELEEIGREIFDLGFGFALDTGERSRLSFSIHEDVVAATGPDFAALLSWSIDL